MYAVYAYIDPSNHPSVGIYGIHGLHGVFGSYTLQINPWKRFECQSCLTVDVCPGPQELYRTPGPAHYEA